MSESEELIEIPGGLAVVKQWVEGLYSDTTDETLWAILNDRLRLANTQDWILQTFARPDDGMAHDLSKEVSVNPHRAHMLRALFERWRSTYTTVSAGFGFLANTEFVGPDMELVVILAPEYADKYAGHIEPRVSIPAHSFITKLTPKGWVIAALSRRLPVPGWPPTVQRIEGLSIDG